MHTLTLPQKSVCLVQIKVISKHISTFITYGKKILYFSLVSWASTAKFLIALLLNNLSEIYVGCRYHESRIQSMNVGSITSMKTEASGIQGKINSHWIFYLPVGHWVKIYACPDWNLTCPGHMDKCFLSLLMSSAHGPIFCHKELREMVAVRFFIGVSAPRPTFYRRQNIKPTLRYFMSFGADSLIFYRSYCVWQWQTRPHCWITSLRFLSDWSQHTPTDFLS